MYAFSAWSYVSTWAAVERFSSPPPRFAGFPPMSGPCAPSHTKKLRGFLVRSLVRSVNFVCLWIYMNLWSYMTRWSYILYMICDSYMIRWTLHPT